jgi:hypothetical protein
MIELGGEGGISRYGGKKDALSMVYKSTMPENATKEFYVRELNMAKVRGINKVRVRAKGRHKLPELCFER